MPKLVNSYLLAEKMPISLLVRSLTRGMQPANITQVTL